MRSIVIITQFYLLIYFGRLKERLLGCGKENCCYFGTEGLEQVHRTSHVLLYWLTLVFQYLKLKVLWFFMLLKYLNYNLNHKQVLLAIRAIKLQLFMSPIHWCRNPKLRLHWQLARTSLHLRILLQRSRNTVEVDKKTFTILTLTSGIILHAVDCIFLEKTLSNYSSTFLIFHILTTMLMCHLFCTTICSCSLSLFCTCT